MPFQYKDTNQQYNGPINIKGSNDTDANFRALSTCITLNQAAPYQRPVLGWAGNGISTAYAKFVVDIPPGAQKVEEVVLNYCAGTPSTDAQVRIGLFDCDSTPTLYTSAVSTLSEGNSNTGSFATLRYTPGANFTMPPYDVLANTGNTRLIGYVQVHNPAVSTIYIEEPEIYFKTGSIYRH